MGRAAIGNDALRLRLGEKIIGCNIVSDRDDLLLVSELGYAKRFPTNLLRLGHRGDLGTFAMQFADKTDNLAGVIVGNERDKVLLKTDRDREIILSINSVALWGKDGSGDRSVKLKPQEKITTLKSIVSN
jgi:DNA gyrase subunit A